MDILKRIICFILGHKSGTEPIMINSKDDSVVLTTGFNWETRMISKHITEVFSCPRCHTCYTKEHNSFATPETVFESSGLYLQ